MRKFKKGFLISHKALLYKLIILMKVIFEFMAKVFFGEFCHYRDQFFQKHLEVLDCPLQFWLNSVFFWQFFDLAKLKKKSLCMDQIEKLKII